MKTLLNLITIAVVVVVGSIAYRAYRQHCCALEDFIDWQEALGKTRWQLSEFTGPSPARICFIGRYARPLADEIWVDQNIGAEDVGETNWAMIVHYPDGATEYHLVSVRKIKEPAIDPGCYQPNAKVEFVHDREDRFLRISK